jgi:hypothetical protein
MEVTTRMTTSTNERLERLDREVEELQQGFVEAVGQLQSAPQVDESHDARWTSIAHRLRHFRTELRPEDYDRNQIAELYTTLFDIRDILDSREQPDLEDLDQLLIQIERVRHVVRDALDEHVTGVAGDIGAVMKELNGWLPNTPQHEIAELVGVNRRTLNRWADKSGPPGRRLEIVARLVAILRHNWSEEGIVAWFNRPRRDLDGRTPLALLKQKNFDEDALIQAARAGRSQYAS